MSIPTALSSMMPWALVFAADMAAGLTLEPKNLLRNEMVGDGLTFKVAGGLLGWSVRNLRLYVLL